MLSVLNPWKLSSLVLNATMCTWVRSRSPRFGLTRLFIRLTVVLEVSGSGIRRRLSGQQEAVTSLLLLLLLLLLLFAHCPCVYLRLLYISCL